MGLLSDLPAEENLSALERIVGAVLENWDAHVLNQAGFEAVVGRKSLSRIVLLGESLFDGSSFPSPPGPFKRAAAVCVLLRMFAEVSFVPKQGNSNLSLEELIVWKARFGLASVPVTLDHMVTTLDGQEVELVKPWEPATLHLQIELLNWLRWLDKPIATPTEEGVAAVIDRSRLQRTVMAMAMVIEQSYYLIGATVECDAMHKASSCIEAIVDDPVLFQDLTLFSQVELVRPDE